LFFVPFDRPSSDPRQRSTTAGHPKPADFEITREVLQSRRHDRGAVLDVAITQLS